MKIGTTGSRVGTTDEQRIVYSREIILLCHDDFNQTLELHDGNCHGWDNDACYVSNLLKGIFQNSVRVVHPCNLTNWQLPLHPDEVAANGWIVRPVKKPLDRNHDIVFESDILFACPANPEKPETLQGNGTWTTIMYAHNMGKEYRIISPDGSIRDKI
jgi:hypothetical protein